MSDRTAKRKNSPWFAFYPDDFDGGTADMSLAAIGAFVRLLNYQFAKGFIPKSDQKLIALVRSNPKEWKKIKDEVLSKFQDDGEGGLMNFRMDQERTIRGRIRDTRIDAANKRWKNADANASPLDEQTGSKSMSKREILHGASTTTTTTPVLSIPEIEPQKPMEPACLSSETHVVPTPTVHPEEGKRASNPKISEESFLANAEKMEVPRTYAVAIFAEMEAKNWIDQSGKPVASPARFLESAWAREQVRRVREQAPTVEGGPRQAWQIDADIARVQAEIKRLNSDPDRKNAAHGHKESRDDYRKRRESEYLATVKELMAQARTVFTAAEFEGFEKSLANLRDEMRKGAAMLGRDVKEVDSEDVAAVHFAEYFPKDCPNFDLWDREWTESTWRDPNALTAEAKVEVRELKAALKRLEGERRRALV